MLPTNVVILSQISPTKCSITTFVGGGRNLTKNYYICGRHFYCIWEMVTTFNYICGRLLHFVGGCYYICGNYYICGLYKGVLFSPGQLSCTQVCGYNGRCA